MIAHQIGRQRTLSRFDGFRENDVEAAGQRRQLGLGRPALLGMPVAIRLSACERLPCLAFGVAEILAFGGQRRLLICNDFACYDWAPRGVDAPPALGTSVLGKPRSPSTRRGTVPRRRTTSRFGIRAALFVTFRCVTFRSCREPGLDPSTRSHGGSPLPGLEGRALG